LLKTNEIYGEMLTQTNHNNSYSSLPTPKLYSSVTFS